MPSSFKEWNFTILCKGVLNRRIFILAVKGSRFRGISNSWVRKSILRILTSIRFNPWSQREILRAASGEGLWSVSRLLARVAKSRFVIPRIRGRSFFVSPMRNGRHFLLGPKLVSLMYERVFLHSLGLMAIHCLLAPYFLI